MLVDEYNYESVCLRKMDHPEANEERQSTTRLLPSVLTVACRGFVVGAGLHLGQQLVSGVTTGKLLSNPVQFLKSIPLADCLRFASFIAAAGSTYKLCLTMLRQTFHTDKGWPAVAAGFAAGLTSLIDEPSRRRTLSLFIIARSLGAFILTLHKRGHLPTVPHSVVLTFGLCQSFIIYCTVHWPALLPVGYYRSLLSWSRYLTDDKLRVMYRTPSAQFTPCSAGIHPGPCHVFVVKDFIQSLILYVKIYASIYSLPLLLFRTKTLFTHTTDAVRTLLTNTAVSALFLAVDGSVIKYCLCLLRNLWGRPPPSVPYSISIVSGFLGVVGLLIERESRRLELLYYVLPQVFFGLWRVLCIKKPLNLHKIPYGSVWVYAFSLAAILHAFEREKHSLSPLINRALHLLLDT